MGCILLRRLLSSNFDEIWPSFPLEMQEGLKRELMLAVREETEQAIRKKVCDVIAELARNMIGTGFFPEVFECYVYICGDSMYF